MANRSAQGMKSMAVHMQMGENVDSNGVEEAFKIVTEKRNPKAERKPIKCLPGERKYQVPDLPLVPFDPARKYANHAVDIMDEHVGELDMKKVDELMDKSDYDSLPEPVSPASPEPFDYSMYLLIIGGEGETKIIKYYQFVGKGTSMPVQHVVVS